jgi:hypothetical protein
MKKTPMKGRLCTPNSHQISFGFMLGQPNRMILYRKKIYPCDAKYTFWTNSRYHDS